MGSHRHRSVANAQEKPNEKTAVSNPNSNTNTKAPALPTLGQVTDSRKFPVLVKEWHTACRSKLLVSDFNI